MARQRVTLIRVEIDASWSSVAWSLFSAVALMAVALWWVYGG